MTKKNLEQACCIATDKIIMCYAVQHIWQHTHLEDVINSA